MKVHIYAKLEDDLADFEPIISSVFSPENDEFLATTENKRTFRQLQLIKKDSENTIFVVKSPESLGLNDAAIATELAWFLDNKVILIISSIPGTYEFGTELAVNQAVLKTLLQTMVNKNKNIVSVQIKRKNGRTRLPFPDNWDELYEEWSNKKISSKEFIEKAGVKKASFYNLLTEYREIQNRNRDYMRRFCFKEA